MGQRGQLDRLPVAHSGPVMDLNWCNASSGPTSHTGSGTGDTGGVSGNLGWIASGGLDRRVKVSLVRNSIMSIS